MNLIGVGHKRNRIGSAAGLSQASARASIVQHPSITTISQTMIAQLCQAALFHMIAVLKFFQTNLCMDNNRRKHH